MTKDQRLADLYRRKEEQRKINAKFPIAEKMATANQLVLTFLLNACWQVALIAAAAMLGDLLLRRTATSYRHFLWMVALVMAPLLPIFSFSSSWRNLFVVTPAPAIAIQGVSIVEAPDPTG